MLYFGLICWKQSRTFFFLFPFPLLFVSWPAVTGIDTSGIDLITELRRMLNQRSLKVRIWSIRHLVFRYEQYKSCGCLYHPIHVTVVTSDPIKYHCYFLTLLVIPLLWCSWCWWTRWEVWWRNCTIPISWTHSGSKGCIWQLGKRLRIFLLHGRLNLKKKRNVF